MGRSSKPIQLVKGHRTKAEKEIREKEEKRLITGTPFKENPEVAKDPVAHKEFERLKKLFKKINKDEGLHQGLINRYCKLHSECISYEEIIINKKLQIETLSNMLNEGTIEILEHIEREMKILDQILACDRKIMDRRKMMLDIEKENIMTIASVLRSVPKAPSEEKETNPFDNILKMSR